MKSREALKELRQYNSVGLCGDKTLFEPIEKDLEILDIFKEQLHINVYIGYFDGKPMYFLKMFEADIFITKEIYDKLKEWLYDEK